MDQQDWDWDGDWDWYPWEKELEGILVVVGSAATEMGLVVIWDGSGDFEVIGRLICGAKEWGRWRG